MADDPLTAIWVYLAASPLLWLTLTLVCYLIALGSTGWAVRAPCSIPSRSPWLF